MVHHMMESAQQQPAGTFNAGPAYRGQHMQGVGPASAALANMCGIFVSTGNMQKRCGSSRGPRWLFLLPR